MIIYGSKMYGKKNQVRSHGRCDHCGRYVPQESYDGRKWGHLYFIPLIPSGGHVRVLRECSTCNTGSHLPIEKVPALLESTRTFIERAIVALTEGEAHFEIEGEKIPVAGAVANNLESLHCLVGEEEVTAYLDTLREAGAPAELLLAEARRAEFTGNRAAADQKYRELTASSDDPRHAFHYAEFLRNTGRPQDALPFAQNVEQAFPEDLNVKQLLLDCYEANQQWDQVVLTYEACFQLVPSLTGQKPLYKKYKKACKKAGRPPQAA